MLLCERQSYGIPLAKQVLAEVTLKLFVTEQKVIRVDEVIVEEEEEEESHKNLRSARVSFRDYTSAEGCGTRLEGWFGCSCRGP